ncbi:centrosome-associated zinc finger protein CP190 [Arctopsyche grandis]|uniref:centrosome-associated zinc finger protein CP190 n=1 Tax=Arctopsyche grandis TaxID=121162 RepID=UPI00406D7683
MSYEYKSRPTKMANAKQVKVDNWGVFFLQRLKQFFNNTDYCDLTLQFRDYAQLKVHRLVLSACTKYFELLEHTCEVYDDCLIMPDDLQADVVVPIINFMYTGQLEYNYNLFDRLYSTAQIMNMNVLTKLLDAQKSGVTDGAEHKQDMTLMNQQLANKSYVRPSTSDDFNNFDNKVNVMAGRKYGPGPRFKCESPSKNHNHSHLDAARPTRYELPEGLDTDEVFETSFADISYESQPLMKATKRRNSDDAAKNIYDEASTSSKFEELKRGTPSYKRMRSSPEEISTSHVNLDQINEFAYQQKLRSDYAKQEVMSEDENQDVFDSLIMDYNRSNTTTTSKRDQSNASNHSNEYQTQSQKTIQKTDSKNSNISIDHAKIISEVLKKYPHLVKSNKNIKLKIMSSKSSSSNASQNYVIEANNKVATAPASPQLKNPVKEEPDWIYVPRTGNADSMASLVALGAENSVGPWLCFLCGTPSKALKFLTYHKYYRHLVDSHKEKIPPKICEYCGFKSGKRNHLLHHMYTKHSIEPPPHYYFPKCNQCSYIALTEAFLIKHKLSHMDNKDYKCGICNSSYKTRPQLLLHIQNTGHKISPDRRGTTKCVYCNKIFLREANLYTHLKVAHKEVAKKDGIIDHSDDEDDTNYSHSISSYNYANSDNQEEHVEIKEEYDGKFQIISNTQINKPFVRGPQKLLNTKFIGKVKEKIKEFEQPVKQYQREPIHIVEAVEQNTENESSSRNTSNMNLVDRIVVFNDNEYILQADDADVYIDTNSKESHVHMKPEELVHPQQSSSINIPIIQNSRSSQVMNANIIKQSQNHNQTVHNIIHTQTQPVQIVVSGNQQYKAIVSSAPVVYNTNNKPAGTDNQSKFVSGQYESIQLENTQGGDVMVLNEEDFQIDCSEPIANDGSNIVVVYSHPVDKQYIQIDNQQFNSVASTRELESQLARVHGEEIENVPLMSEQGIVHETVETWQEGAVGVESSAIVDNRIEDVTRALIGTPELPQEEIKTADQDEVQLSLPQLIETDKIIEKNISQEEQTEPNSTSEVTISSNETNLVNEDNEIVLSFDINMENGIESNSGEKPAEFNSEPEHKEIAAEVLEAVTSVDTHDYTVAKENDTGGKVEITTLRESVHEIANEWSDDDVSPKKDQSEENNYTHESPIISDEKSANIAPEENVEPVAEEQTVNDESHEEISESLQTPMDLEESIENIQDEINKQEIISEQESHALPDLSVCDVTNENVHINEEVLGENENVPMNNESVPIETVDIPTENEDKIESEDVQIESEDIQIENEDIPIENAEDMPVDNNDVPIENEETTAKIEDATIENVTIMNEEVIMETEYMAKDEVAIDSEDVPMEDAEKDDVRMESASNDNKKDSLDKVTSVEKISHLLNDWEDNDSQSEVVMVADSKDGGNVNNSNSNIEKLVSDWDEEDEK